MAAALSPNDKDIRKALQESQEEATVAAALAADTRRKLAAMEVAERAATAESEGDGSGGEGAVPRVTGGGGTAVAARAEVNVELRTYCYMGLSVDGNEVGKLTIQLFDVTAARFEPPQMTHAMAPPRAAHASPRCPA